jgi:hypothetical protein
MAYKIDWLIAERVIEILLPPVCDNAFLKTFDADLNAMLSTSSQPVVILYDLREVRQSPSVQTAFNLTYYKQPNLARILTVGMARNPILRFLCDRVKRSGIEVKDFSTMEEAHAYLAALEKSMKNHIS